MNVAVFELFPCLLRAKQNEIKGLKETSTLLAKNFGQF